MRTCRDIARSGGSIAGRAIFLLVALAALGGGARAQDKRDPTTIVVFGDSQAQGLAVGLQRYLIGRPRYKVLNRTHPGAAIVHGESEWLDPIRYFLAHEKADIAIVMLGANDRLDMRVGKDDRYLHFKTAAWREEYARRLGMILSTLDGARLKSVWLGNPIARSPTYSADMSYINGIIEERVAAAGAQFIPLWNVVVDDGGKYAAYGKDLEGTTERLRTDDGIHFTAAGYRLVAARIMSAVFSKTAAATVPAM
ncbi:MAG TPA: DUF459 domain-containing protein, partial [Stellaceae bacterium]|nr:DUF459 domain-containing protein [Stellaceae bacterium]